MEYHDCFSQGTFHCKLFRIPSGFHSFECCSVKAIMKRGATAGASHVRNVSILRQIKFETRVGERLNMWHLLNTYGLVGFGQAVYKIGRLAMGRCLLRFGGRARRLSVHIGIIVSSTDDTHVHSGKKEVAPLSSVSLARAKDWLFNREKEWVTECKSDIIIYLNPSLASRCPGCQFQTLKWNSPRITQPTICFERILRALMIQTQQTRRNRRRLTIL